MKLEIDVEDISGEGDIPNEEEIVETVMTRGSIIEPKMEK